jgi:XRE family transcriptional regulator, regulator of sulfur utilization
MEDPASRINDAVLRHLARLRKERGLSLEEVARRAGIDRSYLGLLERGMRRPTLEVAIRVARALGQPLSKILKKAEGTPA